MMSDYELAALSDIHGNIWALEAVLRHIDKRGIREIVNLGDSIYGPLDPMRTAQLLMEREFASLSGNEDRMILEMVNNISPTLEFVRNEIDDEVMSWLVAQPSMLRMGDIVMFHGTPESDTEYLLERVTEEGVMIRSPDELSRILDSLDCRIVLCGHSHIPRVASFPEEKVVINPGSVGLQAYTDDSPYPHEMETSSPHARYSLIASKDGIVHIENIVIPYDWSSAERTAARNGRSDWADWLRTGRAKSC